MNVLLVEDDPILGKAVYQGLTEGGHQCRWLRNGAHGYDQALSQRFDVLLLDLLLPGKDGLEVLSDLRHSGVGTPVLILTALGSVDDRVRGLKNGADDYMVKPFAMPELLARLEVLQRRSAPRPAPMLEVGDLKLDLASRRVSRAGAEIELTPTEFTILELLMRHVGQVVTRKMLCETLWSSDWEGTTNVIEVHINRLRNKLQRGQPEQLIHTVRGRGYVFRSH